MKKLLLAITSIFALGTFAMGAEPVTVNIFQFKVEIAEELNILVKDYMKENPNVKITVETVGGGSDYGAALRAKIASGNEPAIFNIGGPQDFYDWKDKVADLSAVPVIKLALPGSLAGVTLDKKVYGIPYTQEGYGFIYNKEIFKKAGIKPESITSFAKLEEAVKLLDSKKAELKLDAVFAVAGKETWVTGLHFTNVALSQEFGNVLNAYNSKTVAFKYSDGMKKLFDLQINYAKKPINSTDYSMQVEKLFSLGKVAMMQQGTWTLGSIRGIDKKLADNVGFLPMPIVGSGKEDYLPIGIPMYWTVNNSKDAATQKASKDFLNWMYSSEKGKNALVNKFGFIPPFKGYEAANLQPKDPLSVDLMKYAKAGKTLQWVFMGYPTGWGMEKIGVHLQKYVDGSLTWDKVVEQSKKDWADARKK